jgi:hypothetical protein
LALGLASSKGFWGADADVGLTERRKQHSAPPTMNAVKQIVYSSSPTDIVENWLTRLSNMDVSQVFF